MSADDGAYMIGGGTTRPLSRIPSVNSLDEDLYMNGPGPTIVENKSIPPLAQNRDLISSVRFSFGAPVQRPRSRSPSHYPIGTGRPRRENMQRASVALNEAYNCGRPSLNADDEARASDAAGASSSSDPDQDDSNDNDPDGNVLKCAIHGEGCDGTTVTNEHNTEHIRSRRGFLEEFPMIEREGRTMIDWYKLVKEEAAKRGQVIGGAGVSEQQ